MTTTLKNFRALLVSDDYIIGSKGYKLCKYNIANKELRTYAKIADRKHALLSRFFLTRRLFRAEVMDFIRLKDRSEILIAKKGIFKKASDSNLFKKVFHVPRGSRPRNICLDEKTNYIYFGEYFANLNKEAVHIYASQDNGENWNIVYTFDAGNINHIHGVFYDAFTSNLWVVTGDRENECIIGYTTDGFKSFVEVFRGGQEYRSCTLMFYKNHIVFVTDSQYMQNEIKYFDRDTLVLNTAFEISGSGLYAGQCGDLVFCSSTIEPSDVNLEQYSHLYLSYDQGKSWQDIIRYKKDIWHKNLFQFGSILFPRYLTNKSNLIVFTGRALKSIDGNTVLMPLKGQNT